MGRLFTETGFEHDVMQMIKDRVKETKLLSGINRLSNYVHRMLNIHTYNALDFSIT